jgi:hypothetical protein
VPNPVSSSRGWCAHGQYSPGGHCVTQFTKDLVKPFFAFYFDMEAFWLRGLCMTGLERTASTMLHYMTTFITFLQPYAPLITSAFCIHNLDNAYYNVMGNSYWFNVKLRENPSGSITTDHMTVGN